MNKILVLVFILEINYRLVKCPRNWKVFDCYSSIYEGISKGWFEPLKIEQIIPEKLSDDEMLFFFHTQHFVYELSMDIKMNRRDPRFLNHKNPMLIMYWESMNSYARIYKAGGGLNKPLTPGQDFIPEMINPNCSNLYYYYIFSSDTTKRNFFTYAARRLAGEDELVIWSYWPYHAHLEKGMLKNDVYRYSCSNFEIGCNYTKSLEGVSNDYDKCSNQLKGEKLTFMVFSEDHQYFYGVEVILLDYKVKTAANWNEFSELDQFSHYFYANLLEVDTDFMIHVSRYLFSFKNKNLELISKTETVPLNYLEFFNCYDNPTIGRLQYKGTITPRKGGNIGQAWFIVVDRNYIKSDVDLVKNGFNINFNEYRNPTRIYSHQRPILFVNETLFKHFKKRKLDRLRHIYVAQLQDENSTTYGLYGMFDHLTTFRLNMTFKGYYQINAFELTDCFMHECDGSILQVPNSAKFYCFEKKYYYLASLDYFRSPVLKPKRKTISKIFESLKYRIANRLESGADELVDVIDYQKDDIDYFVFLTIDFIIKIKKEFLNYHHENDVPTISLHRNVDQQVEIRCNCLFSPFYGSYKADRNCSMYIKS